MALKKGIPGTGKVRKSRVVGPDFADDRFHAPWNAEYDHPFGEARDDKAVMSEAGMVFEADDQPIEKGNYDKYWDGK